LNWLIAHRVASIAATNLRNRMGIPDDRYVDVFEALGRCGLMVQGDDMPSLFGIYLPATPGRRNGGILLNSTMGETTLRHTAAHELGHAELGHERCLAGGLDPFAGLPLSQWPDEEKQAEAFAAWFLMPIRAVKTVLTRLGRDIPREAADAYQLSLHLGTSYRGMIRHLQHLRMVKPAVATDWKRIQPARLWAQLAGHAEQPPDRVWDLTSLTDGCELAIESGDRLIVRTPWLTAAPRVTGPDAVIMPDESKIFAGGDRVILDVEGSVSGRSSLIVTSSDGAPLWTGTLLPTPDDHRGLIAAAHKPVLVGPQSGARR
jgi:hypothetical protein